MDEDVVAELPECREMIADVEKCLALKDASKVPMSVRYPEQFATRGTITVSRCTVLYTLFITKLAEMLRLIFIHALK